MSVGVTWHGTHTHARARVPWSAGEMTWVKTMVERFHALAEKNGAYIVNCCGFDCVPPDLTSWLAENNVREMYGTPRPPPAREPNRDFSLRAADVGERASTARNRAPAPQHATRG